MTIKGRINLILLDCFLVLHSERVLHGFDHAVWSLKGDPIVTAIAKWTVGGSSASTERESRLPGRIVFIAIRVEQFDETIRVFHTQWPVLAHRNLNLPHANLQQRVNDFKNYLTKHEDASRRYGAKLPYSATESPRHLSTASHQTIFSHSSKVVFAHSRWVHHFSPNCQSLCAAAMCTS